MGLRRRRSRSPPGRRSAAIRTPCTGAGGEAVLIDPQASARERARAFAAMDGCCCRAAPTWTRRYGEPPHPTTLSRRAATSWRPLPGRPPATAACRCWACAAACRRSTSSPAARWSRTSMATTRRRYPSPEAQPTQCASSAPSRLAGILGLDDGSGTTHRGQQLSPPGDPSRPAGRGLAVAPPRRTAHSRGLEASDPDSWVFGVQNHPERAGVHAAGVRPPVGGVRRGGGRSPGQGRLGQVHVDVLELGVQLQRVHAQLAPDARHLVAAERRLGVDRCVRVDASTPARTPLATRSARPMSRLQIEPDSPYGVSLASLIASASSSNGMIVTTGPKISSRTMRMSGPAGVEDGRQQVGADVERVAGGRLAAHRPARRPRPCPPPRTPSTRSRCLKLTRLPTSVCSSDGSPTLHRLGRVPRGARRRGRGR